MTTPVEERRLAAGCLPELKNEPTWDALGSNPRFVAVVKKVGLEK